MEKLTTYVMTCDKYMDVIPIFAHQANKYWPGQEFVVVGFTYPQFRLPPNFRFMSLGAQENYPVGKWSDAFLRMLDLIPDELFCFMLEDYFITEPVKVNVVNILYRYMLGNRCVIKMDLCADRQFAKDVLEYGWVGGIHLVKSTPNTPYHLSLMTGIWRKELLYQVIIPGESPWDVELRGTERLSELGDTVQVLGSKSWPVRHGLGYRGGDPTNLILSELSEDDFNELVELNFVEVDQWG